eukprot:s1715_g1.t1
MWRARLGISSGKTFILFTDGSFEASAMTMAGIGGVLYDDSGTPISFFSGSVNQRDLDHMDHPIYAIELLAVLAAFECWGHVLKDSFTVSYVDNTDAQAALAAGSSGNDVGSEIVELIGMRESSLMCRPWYSWVPTHSNPADPPSRNDCAALLSLGIEKIHFDKRLLSRDDHTVEWG